MTQTVELPPTRNSASQPVEQVIDGEAKAARRINIPLNLNNWKNRTDEEREVLTWFHQYILVENLGWEAIENAIGYDSSNLNRILNGTYAGNWSNIIKEIRAWRKVVNLQADVQDIQFSPNNVSERVDWILNYTWATSKLTLMLGESGVGKNAAAEHWVKDNNHGRSVFVESHAIGGAKGLLIQIAEKVGVNKSLKTNEMIAAVTKAFNKERILVINEIQHHVPTTATTRPIALEMVRRIHDISKCGLALIGTYRVEDELKDTNYMYEQIIGRSGKPFYLPNKFASKDILGIVTQFVKAPTDSFVEKVLGWANDRSIGHLRYMVEIFRFASQLANKNKKPLTEQYILAAHKKREEQSGFKPGAIQE